MKQTAVEFLELMFLRILSFDSEEHKKKYKDVIRQAKEMEKEQQGYSEEDMAESFMACWKANVPEGFECKLSFKEWFNEFKKK